MTGTTSRTLRHDDAVGLLKPVRMGSNGYRCYGTKALLRLQRILLLRDLGLWLTAIAAVLDREPDTVRALRMHRDWLRAEQERIAGQIAAVTTTVEKLEAGEQLMAEDMFTGFDNTQYKDEVEQRWGKDSYANSDRWRRSLMVRSRNNSSSSGISILRPTTAGPGTPVWLRAATRSRPS